MQDPSLLWLNAKSLAISAINVDVELTLHSATKCYTSPVVADKVIACYTMDASHGAIVIAPSRNHH